jgi:Helix-turn-helix domain
MTHWKQQELSIKIIEAVLEMTLGSSTDKLVLLVLADHADEFAQCWPGIDRLSEQTELTPRAINKSLKRLKAGGHIEVIHRHRRSNLFTLNHVPVPLHLVQVRGERGSRYPERRSLRTVKDPSSEPSKKKSERPLETVVDKIRSQEVMRLIRSRQGDK